MQNPYAGVREVHNCCCSPGCGKDQSKLIEEISCHKQDHYLYC